MDISKTRVLADILVIVIGILVLLFYLYPLPPTRRGFYCDDESIRYIFHGETISPLTLLLLVIPPGSILIIFTEFGRGLVYSSGRQWNFGGFMVNEWIGVAYKILVDYLIAVVLLEVVVSILKPVIGSLRPVFIDMCRPNVDLDGCASYHHKYITDYKCHNDDLYFRRSFPSGHSAQAGFATLFSVFYIHAKWTVPSRSTLRLAKHFVIAAVIAGYGCIALSRYKDNVHHPIDIVVGYGIGAMIGLYTVFYSAGESNEDNRLPLLTTQLPSSSGSKPLYS